MQKIVTVIIPVYNQLEHLRACIQSCREHIDQRHQIVILDDASPEAGFPDAVRSLIAGAPNIRYERNETNLGFVGTCNRAYEAFATPNTDILLLNSDTRVTAHFLEELLLALYACDRHGVCCPRSNEATLCTIPLKFSGDRSRFAEISFRCFEKMRDLMPPYAVVPTGVGFCMLIRRDLIERFGFLDTVYGRGYNEENDFCARINRYGFSVVLCNRAFVYHDGGATFSSHEKARLEQENRKILLSRYPEYATSVDAYFTLGLPAYEHFADVLGECYPRRRLLIDLSQLHAMPNGTTQVAVSVLTAIYPLLEKEWDITIFVNKKSDEFLGLTKRYPTVIHEEAEADGRYDLAFVPHQIFTAFHLQQMNRMAVRWCVIMLDIIILRCRYLYRADTDFAFRFLAGHADGILSISDSSHADLQAYFGPHALPSHILQKAVLLTCPRLGIVPLSEHSHDSQKIPKEPFVLLIGNHFHHKAVHLALKNIPKDVHTVVLGGLDLATQCSGPKRTFLHSGKVSFEFVRELCRRSETVVFPTQYEGFGFPLLEAVSEGKAVIACQTETLREVATSFGVTDAVLWFRKFEQIPELLVRARGMKVPQIVLQRTWNDVAQDIAEFLFVVQQKPIDISRLEERFWILRQMERITHEAWNRSILSKLVSKTVHYWKLGARKIKRTIHAFCTILRG